MGLAGADMGACALLPRVIGQGRASELLFTGRAMTAQEGLAWGFFNALHESADLLPKAQALAAELAAGPTFAHGMTKTMLQQEWAMTIEQAVEAEAHPEDPQFYPVAQPNTVETTSTTKTPEQLAVEQAARNRALALLNGTDGASVEEAQAQKLAEDKAEREFKKQQAESASTLPTAPSNNEALAQQQAPHPATSPD